MTEFSETYINWDTEGWHSAHFLKLNDDTAANGTKPWCGAECV